MRLWSSSDGLGLCPLPITLAGGDRLPAGMVDAPARASATSTGSTCKRATTSFVITAAQRLRVPFPFDDERAAMRADVRQTMRLHPFIDSQQERLIQTTFQQSKRAHMTGRFHLRGFADELPGAR